jgi:hypothetical protein
VAELLYKRLTRPRLRWKGAASILRTSRQSLWLGDDHLLSIDATSYAEQYKRFYFRDVQAVFVCPTDRRAIWNGILGSVLIMHLLIFGWLGAPAFMLISLAIAFTLPLVINNVMGPACKTYVRTAVQVEELPSLNRIKRTKKVLARIRPLISAVQGSVSPEELADL